MPNTSVTAWGRPNIKTGASGTGGSLGTTLSDVGKIKKDTAVLELIKGEVMELRGEGNELIDKMELEGDWRLFFTIYKASLEKVAELFNLTLDSENELPMGTTIVSEPRSYVVDPLLVGAIGARLPNCSTSITPRWVAQEGWAIDVEATTLVPEDDSVKPATLYKKKAPTNEG
jgi:hypothetical protein